jgi:predicted amidohydrolase
MRVLSVNFCSREGDIAGNVARAASLIRAHHAADPVDLVVLPELFTSGYCALDLTPWAETPGSPTFATFAALAAELDVVIGWGFAERSDVPGMVYNAYALLEPGQAPVFYRKTHLHRSRPGTAFHEPGFLLPGPRLEVFPTRLGRLGVMICYDGCFAEVPRTLALMGADVILWPTRSGTYLAGAGFPVMRAVDNSLPILMAEGAQEGDASPLQCHAQLVDHYGRILAEYNGREALLAVDIDLAAMHAARATGIHQFAQYQVRRPELYGVITEH